MNLEESPLPQLPYTASAKGSKPDEDLPCSDADRSQDDVFDTPFPPPPDSGPMERGYAVEIYGDERGGQKAKRPQKKADI